MMWVGYEEIEVNGTVLPQFLFFIQKPTQVTRFHKIKYSHTHTHTHTHTHKGETGKYEQDH
jgi:hypothetical protein